VFAAALDKLEQPPIPRNGSAWCSTFQKFIFTKTGAVPALRGAVMFYTPADANVFRKAGAYYADPEPGDLAFYYSTVKKRIAHVGIVESVEKSYIVTLEGNTAAGAIGSQDNGGGVYRRRRLRSWWAGYGRPDWALIPSTPIAPPASQEDEPMKLFRPEGFYDILVETPKGYDHAEADELVGLIDANLVTPFAKGDRDYDARAIVLPVASWTFLAGHPPQDARPAGEV
jgi:hypothetical protein